jgi:hypothetical protein
MEPIPINALWANFINTLNKLGIPEEKVNFHLSLWLAKSMLEANIFFTQALTARFSCSSNR